MSTVLSVTKKQSRLDGQFGHLSGIMGTLVGVAMALEHKALHKAVVNKRKRPMNPTRAESGLSGAERGQTQNLCVRACGREVLEELS